MELPVLPACRWRGEELSDGRYACSSPKLLVGPNGVSAKLCAGCYCADHEAPAELPGLLASGVHFAAAMGKHLLNRGKNVDEATYQRRVALCVACEHYDDGRCRKCGCKVAGSVVAKARWASEKCPLGKW
jgi:hypothetical protein